MTQHSPTAALPAAAGRQALAWALALALALAALLLPGLWNGYPLAFFDTAGYLKRVFEWQLEPGRSLFYGVFLLAASGGWTSLWGPVLAQAAMAVWLVHLALRTHDLPSGPAPTAGAVLALCLLTGISWYAAQLMPDVLVPLLVLGLWLLGFRWERLSKAERAGIAAIALLGLMSHMGSMALAMGLVAVTAALALLARRFGWAVRARVLPPAAVVLASLVLMPLLHLAIVGKATFTPGGPVFVFGRLVQDGIAQRYLDDHCPDATLKLCDFRAEMPKTANDFIWHTNSPFQKIGGWGGSDAELSRITRETLAAYPGMHFATAIRATWQQILKAHTGDGLDENHEATRWIMAGHLGEHTGYFSARQQTGGITQGLFDALNAVHIPVAHLSTLGLVLLAAWGLRAGRHDLTALALFTLLALLGNAFISGVLSNPHDRYQSRLVWLATLVALMGAAAWRRERRTRP